MFSISNIQRFHFYNFTQPTKRGQYPLLLIWACILYPSSQVWILDPWSYHRNAIQCSPFSFPSYSSVLAPVLGRCANRLEQVASSPTLPMGCPRHLAAELPVHLDQALPTSYLCSWTNLWRSLWRSRKIFKDSLWKSLITNPTHRRNIMLLDIETRERNPNGIGLLPGEKSGRGVKQPNTG